jgi:hypothetical protein
MTTKKGNDRIKARRQSGTIRGNGILTPRLLDKEEIVVQNGLTDWIVWLARKSQAGTPVPPNQGENQSSYCPSQLQPEGYFGQD